MNSSDPDFAEQLRMMAQKLQATLLLDATGGSLTQQLAEAARLVVPFCYTRACPKDCIIDARTGLIKNLHFGGWFLPNWLRDKNLLQVLQLSQQAQSHLANDLQSPIHKRFPLAAAQKGLATYVRHMSAGKIMLVANPQQVTLDG